MSTLIYQPRVMAMISISDANGNNERVIDISEDLVAGNMVLRTEGVHTFQFQLQNPQRKYDGKIKPMDRIIVSMQRIGQPIRVFSGYMNVGPVYSVWPRVLSLSASCTLKRLQYWYWDSGSAESSSLISQMGAQIAGGSGNTADSGTPSTNAAQNSGDGGMRDLTLALLDKIVGWPSSKVHIGAIPNDWFSFATDVGDEIIKAADYSNLIGSMGNGMSGGSGISGGTMLSGALAPGTYAGFTVDQEQANNAATIAGVAAQRGLAPRAAAQGIATAIVESTLRNLNHGDRDSLGLFQQRPSQGWGSAAQIMDPQYAAGKFFDALVKVPGYQTGDFGLTCQAVQRSGFPGRYGKQEAPAEAMVAAIQNTAVGNAQGVVGGNGGSIGSTANTGKPQGATGRNVAAQGYNLIVSHPPGYIRYREGGDDPYNSPDPRVLDCSSFVDVAYYRACGRPLNTPRSTVASIRPKCTIIPADLAKQIKGAMLFMGTHHVEVSLGNGNTAAAHTDGIPLEKQVNVSPAGNGFDAGGLLPGVNYADAATTPAAAQLIQSKLGYSANVSDPNEFGTGSPVDAAQGSANGGTGVSAQDVFNSLINIYTWGYTPNVASIALAGPRALMNDQPILPFIANLMSASMRSWCSAPNGDFMAWFPDYFDLWGITAKLDVHPIELMDFTVTWSDLQTVTHQYVVGTPLAVLAIDQSGATQSTIDDGTGGLAWQLTTSGIATMEFPQIFRAIFGQDASQQFLDNFLGRFGARPNTVTIPTVKQGMPEFFMALFLFMRKWSNQFAAEVPMTWMPEAWPGMILRLPEFNFQAYIAQVEHSFQMGKDGFFRTSAQVIAPSRISQKENDVFGMLPLGGKRYDVKRLDTGSKSGSSTVNSSVPGG